MDGGGKRSVNFIIRPIAALYLPLGIRQWAKAEGYFVGGGSLYSCIQSALRQVGRQDEILETNTLKRDNVSAIVRGLNVWATRS